VGSLPLFCLHPSTKSKWNLLGSWEIFLFFLIDLYPDLSQGLQKWAYWVSDSTFLRMHRWGTSCLYSHACPGSSRKLWKVTLWVELIHLTLGSESNECVVKEKVFARTGNRIRDPVSKAQCYLWKSHIQWNQSTPELRISLYQANALNSPPSGNRG